jgi:VIT1/CCC1 family predicted Fe2+/Mn2+ transporter
MDVSDDLRRDLDLTHEVPTDRAAVGLQLKKVEKITIEVKMPGWTGGSTFTLTAEGYAGSPQSIALTTAVLLVIGGLLACIASVIGASALTALIIGLCVPIVTYALVRAMSGHWAR